MTALITMVKLYGLGTYIGGLGSTQCVFSITTMIDDDSSNHNDKVIWLKYIYWGIG